MKKICLMVIISAVVTGACSTTSVPLNSPTTNLTAEQLAKTESVDTSTQSLDSHALIDRNDNNKVQSTVYFDFDSFIVKPEYHAMIENQAKYLLSHKNIHIQIAGHTDQSGPPEYNMALGNKRAQAVKTILNLLGVPNSRIESISYGKEKPITNEVDSASRAKNRRAEIKYP